MLEIKDISKQYEGKPLLCGVSFTVARDETVCLLGPSGGGKSTILRIIAGLERPASGEILWDGKNVGKTPPHLREFGLMFQDYALFPHLNVRDNIAFGLRSNHMPETALDERVDEVLAMVDMRDFKDRSVIDLSGGEKQRIAFARAIAPNPRMLMLDEPMGALDRTLKEQLLNELHDLLAKTDIPVIYVTHDQEEAFSVADRVLILHEGRIVQAGTPEQVYAHPGDAWIASFLGFKNFIDGKVRTINPLTVTTGIGDLEVACEDGSLMVGDAVDLVLLSALFETGDTEITNAIACRVLESRFLGDSYKVKVRVETGGEFTFATDISIAEKKDRTIIIPPASILCFKRKI